MKGTSSHKKTLSGVPLFGLEPGPVTQGGTRASHGQASGHAPSQASGKSPGVSRRNTEPLAEATPVMVDGRLSTPATGASGILTASSSSMSRHPSSTVRQLTPPSPSPVLMVDDRAASVTCTGESVFINYASPAPWACVSGCLPRLLSGLDPRRSSEDVPYSEILSAQLCLSKGSSNWLTPAVPGETYEMELCTFVRSKSKGKRSLWEPRVIRVASPEREPVERCMAEIQRHLRGFTERPKSLLVLINPYGGTKKAALVYEREVKLVFEKAGIQVLLRTTQCSGDAKATVCRTFGSMNSLEDVDEYGLPTPSLAPMEPGSAHDGMVDGVVAVGGDGLFHEVVAGILEMDMAHRIRVAHVAAGSTDAVAYTLNGTRSAFTAAAHVVLGDSIPLDVLRLDCGQENQASGASSPRGPTGSPGSSIACIHPGSRETTKFALSMASFGFFGDVMEESEKWRWIGPMRYDLVGAGMWMLNKSYRARVEYLPAPRELSSRQVICTKDCPVCLQPSHGRLNPAHKSFKLHAQNSLMRCESDWRVVEGEFAGIMLVIMPCRSEKSEAGVCRYSHLSDGRVHLVMIKACSRWRYLRFLLRLSKQGLETGSTDDGIIQVEACAAIKITHLEPTGQANGGVTGNGKDSVWNVDGELLHIDAADSVLYGEVHRSSVRAFSRGVEE